MAAADDLVVKVRTVFDPPIEEVRRLSIKPGDVVVVKLSDALADVDALRERLDGVFPDNRVLVLASDVDLYVASPEEVGEHPGEIGVDDPFRALKRLFRR